MSKDSLLFFGNGGGHYNSVTQYLPTGGFQIIIGNSFRVHVDPGPSTASYLKELHVDPESINVILATHSHLDHAHDIPVLAEGMRIEKKQPPTGYLATTVDTVAGISEYHRGFFKQVYFLAPGDQCELLEKGTSLTIQATRAIHSKGTEAIGFIISTKNWSLGITGDTVVFPGFAEQYSHVNYLVAYLRGPDNYVSKSHLSLEPLIESVMAISKTAHLRAVILTHFGWRITNPGGPIRSQEQAVKLKKATGVPCYAAYLGFSYPL